MPSQEILDMIFQYGPIIATVAITWIAKGWRDWNKVKGKLSQFREVIVEIDEAVKDDNVSEEEFRRIWNKGKNFITFESKKL